jgi:hypothetical protein
MSDFHIDAILGPERNPRQGVGAHDILRWQEGWRKQQAARREARRSERRREREVESSLAIKRLAAGDMDRFFAKLDQLPGAWKPAPDPQDGEESINKRKEMEVGV